MGAPLRGNAAEVIDEVGDDLRNVLGALTASALLVLEAEQLLRPSQQPGEITFREPQQKKDYVAGLSGRDLCDELTLGTFLCHQFDVLDGEPINPRF